MLQSQFENTRRLRLVFLATVTVFFLGCAATVPDTARVQDAEIPNYKVSSHRVEESIDLYIEPQIRNLQASVMPRSESEVFQAIPVIVGPALEKALLSMTRQYFSKITPVGEPEDRPTLTYKLLTYRPVVSVEPGANSTRLNVSARLALQVSIDSANGKELFSTTAIGTSHVSDTKLPGLLEVATRNAIIDAMYDISSIFGNSNDMIYAEVLASEIDPEFGIEKIDDVILNLRTRRKKTAGH
jgi:hypothetical protein